jgi:hypothetical protein
MAKIISADGDLLAAIAALAELSESAAPAVDRDALAAADLLGVSLSATVEEVRKACRQKIVAEGLHPDHGGDEERVRKVIAARDLLVERLKVRS